MSLVDNSIEDGRILLLAYKAYLAQQLHKEFSIIANAIVCDAVEAAMAELKINIEAQHDDLRDRLVMYLSINGVKQEPK